MEKSTKNREVINGAKLHAKKIQQHQQKAAMANITAGKLLSSKNKKDGTVLTPFQQFKAEREKTILKESTGKYEEVFTTYKSYLKTEAMRILNISSVGMYHRLKKLGIKKEGVNLHKGNYYKASDLRKMAEVFAPSKNQKKEIKA